MNFLGLQDAVAIAVEAGLDGLSTSRAIGASGFRNHIDEAADRAVQRDSDPEKRGLRSFLCRTSCIAFSTHEQISASKSRMRSSRMSGVAAGATGHYTEAETWLRAARTLGNPSCNLAVKLGQLLAHTGHTQEGASEYEAAGACSHSDPRPWLAAAALWEQLGRSDEVSRALARAKALPLAQTQRVLLDQLAKPR